MLRYIGPFIAPVIGIGFLLALFWGFITTPHEAEVVSAAHVYHREPKDISFSFDGPLGRYDRQQLQRGFQVYKEVCSACHSMKYVAFRDLEGIGFSKPEVKAIAKQWPVEVPAINPDTGEPTTRKALPSDYFPASYANETAARAANNNALPPDLSLMAKAREGGAHYVFSLLTGYEAQPAELVKRFPDARTPEGLHYNPYFANLNIAMPPPLVAEGQVTYADGTEPTVAQMADDVAAFLMWAAEPKLENRHRAGVGVVIYLLIATALAYAAYRNIWRGKKH
ncbi:cytochrome c1 [uncultured Sphingomonas sp.]|uniref:cytochrome c1 n=1 Tax=uncultured Sphingomonas sp. TaxID=158754 RepID=UPI0025E1CF6E|nr:cytochrome c1 [uncultured Sphingomonas sp.]